MHHRSRSTRTVVAVFVGLLILSACGRADLPTETWTGVSISDGTERSVTLEVERRGDRLTGEYRVEGIPGAFDGTVDDGTLTAELRASDDCTYTLDGTITDVRIDASYAPTDCPGGDTGTWSLERDS